MFSKQVFSILEIKVFQKVETRVRYSWNLVKKPVEWLLVPTEHWKSDNKREAQNVWKNVEGKRTNVRRNESEKRVVFEFHQIQWNRGH